MGSNEDSRNLQLPQGSQAPGLSFVLPPFDLLRFCGQYLTTQYRDYMAWWLPAIRFLSLLALQCLVVVSI